MKHIKLLPIALILFSFHAHAGSHKLVLNGKTYKCSEPLVVENGSVTCKKKVMKALPRDWYVSQTETVCGNEQVKTYENGGGTVSVRASIHPKAFIDKDAVVCGTSQIGKPVKLIGKTTISGSVRLNGTSTITNSTITGASEVLSSEVTDSTISGSSLAQVSTIKNSVLSGIAKTIASKVEDNSEISGTSEVRNSKIYDSKVMGASYISDDSLIEGSTLLGAVRVKHGRLNKCNVYGSTQFLNQTCKDDTMLY